MVPDTSIVVRLPAERTAGDTLAHPDRLDHRAVAAAAPTEVVDRPHAGRAVERLERPRAVGGVDVVPHLLAAVAEDRVALARHGAAHQVRQEPVELRTSVVGPGQAAASEAGRGHLEVAPVLL